MQEIVEADNRTAYFRPHATVVIVAPNEEIPALARQWEEMVQHLGWKTHISRERSAAPQWLRENFPAAADEDLVPEKRF
ncbi:hypothetical protein BH20VER3_BH20VER3_23000 [soil metagenome]